MGKTSMKDPLRNRRAHKDLGQSQETQEAGGGKQRGYMIGTGSTAMIMTE